jgi:hypothetical protein
MCGVIMRGETWTPRQIWEVADEMVEARKPPEVGIKTVKRTRKTND